MGGSGGGGYGGLGGYGTDQQVNCLRLTFETAPQLAGATAEAIDGEILQLALLAEEGGAIVALLNDDAELIGVVSDEVLDLIRCIKSGTAYVAEVTIDGDYVRARVRPATIERIEGSTFSSLKLVQVGWSLTVDQNSVSIVSPDGPEVSIEDVGICELRALLVAGVSFEVRDVQEESITLGASKGDAL